jgi:hypothetical protein
MLAHLNCNVTTVRALYDRQWKGSVQYQPRHTSGCVDPIEMTTIRWRSAVDGPSSNRINVHSLCIIDRAAHANILQMRAAFT